MRNVSNPWNKLVDKYQTEIFLLTCKLESFEPSRGTAFHIGGGKIATARHCVYDRHGEIRHELRLDIDGNVHSPVAIRPDAQVKQTIDIAALEVGDLAPRRGIPTQLRLPQIGEEVAAIGFPRLPYRSRSLVLHVGIVEALPTDYKGEQRFIQVSFQSGGGLSGGCLIDKSGHALGIMTENIYIGGISRNRLAGSDLSKTPDEDGDKDELIDGQDEELMDSSATVDQSKRDIAESDDENSGVPRPYGQAVPMEYLDSFIHGDNLIPEETTEADPEVFSGVPPDWYKEGSQAAS